MVSRRSNFCRRLCGDRAELIGSTWFGISLGLFLSHTTFDASNLTFLPPTDFVASIGSISMGKLIMICLQFSSNTVK